MAGIKLSERLKAAAEAVRPGSVVADVGSDHAYLPAYLVLNGLSPRAIAADVRAGPLENARKTVRLYGLEDKICLRLSDGLDNIEPCEASDFTICGMGGTLTARLLSRVPWLKDPSKRIIVQPQSRAEEVRGFFADNGFKILFEDVRTDAGRLYCTTAAEYDGNIVQRPVSYVYTGEVPRLGTREAEIYLRNVRARILTKSKAARLYGSPKNADYFERIARETEELINGTYADG